MSCWVIMFYLFLTVSTKIISWIVWILLIYMALLEALSDTWFFFWAWPSNVLEQPGHIKIEMFLKLITDLLGPQQSLKGYQNYKLEYKIRHLRNILNYVWGWSWPSKQQWEWTEGRHMIFKNQSYCVPQHWQKFFWCLKCSKGEARKQLCNCLVSWAACQAPDLEN